MGSQRLSNERFWMTAAISTILLWACGSDSKKPQPTIVCEVTYGGESRMFVITPTVDPYGVKPFNINDRFEFKAVLTMESDGTGLVNLYTSNLSPTGRALIHEMKMKLKSPFAPQTNESEFGFTGRQFVYEKSSGRELSYHCGYRRP